MKGSFQLVQILQILAVVAPNVEVLLIHVLFTFASFKELTKITILSIWQPIKGSTSKYFMLSKCHMVIIFRVYYNAHMTLFAIWTLLRWSWPLTGQTHWTLPCYVLVVWTERLSSPCLTADRNVSFSPPSPVKWISLRRLTWRTVSLWFNNCLFEFCFCVCLCACVCV